MATVKMCACKGIRTCLICENTKRDMPIDTEMETFLYCRSCRKAFPCEMNLTQESTNINWITCLDNMSSNCSLECQTKHSIDFPGVEIITDFVSETEEEMMVCEMNKTTWVDSQSGRRKQDYGPKVNFKKKKLRTSAFTGLPPYSQLIISRMQKLTSLSSFTPVELCNLEYTHERGSAIDPHFDDTWLWGERLVTLNLLSPIVYTMSNPDQPTLQVHILFPRRSLMILSGPARYDWMHSIERKYVLDLRIGITIREFTPEFLPGGTNEDVGHDIIETALTFTGRAVHEHVNV